MFIAVVLAVVPNWKQPNLSSIGEWMNALWYGHTKEYCSAIKREYAIDIHNKLSGPPVHCTE